jgi:hypothetical protein
MVEIRQIAMFDIKCASADLDTCKQIMQQVYDERPEHWPYGLSAGHFDGGLWMIRKQASGEPAGFVGWQERCEQGRRVGYYSVGMLPQYRGRGMAKTAVNRLLADKAANVDVVRALIGDHNEASQNLAKALQPLHNLEVDLFKQAREKRALSPEAAKTLKQLLGYTAGGYGNTVFWDQVMHPQDPVTTSMQPWKWDKYRQLIGGMNSLLGAGGPALIHHGVKPQNAEHGAGFIGGGASTIALSPIKDLALASLPLAQQTGGLIKDVQNRANRPPSPLTNIDPKWLAGGAAAGLLGMGGLAYAGVRGAKAMNAIADKSSKGTVRVKLPSRGPTEAETEVEMPIEDVRLSDSIYHALGRDTRRRLRGESSERKRQFMTEQQRAKNLGINMDDDAQIINEPTPL